MAKKKYKGEKTVELKIMSQGAPVVNDAVVYVKAKGIILVTVDMKSKYCEISSTGLSEYPFIVIDTNKDSINLCKGIEREEPTIVGFPEFMKYDIFSATLSRYTARITFERKEI